MSKQIQFPAHSASCAGASALNLFGNSNLGIVRCSSTNLVVGLGAHYPNRPIVPRRSEGKGRISNIKLGDEKFHIPQKTMLKRSTSTKELIHKPIAKFGSSSILMGFDPCLTAHSWRSTNGSTYEPIPRQVSRKGIQFKHNQSAIKQRAAPFDCDKTELKATKNWESASMCALREVREKVLPYVNRAFQVRPNVVDTSSNLFGGSDLSLQTRYSTTRSSFLEQKRVDMMEQNSKGNGKLVKHSSSICLRHSDKGRETNREETPSPSLTQCTSDDDDVRSQWIDKYKMKTTFGLDRGYTMIRSTFSSHFNGANTWTPSVRALCHSSNVRDNMKKRIEMEKRVMKRERNNNGNDSSLKSLMNDSFPKRNIKVNEIGVSSLSSKWKLESSHLFCTNDTIQPSKSSSQIAFTDKFQERRDVESECKSDENDVSIENQRFRRFVSVLGHGSNDKAAVSSLTQSQFRLYNPHELQSTQRYSGKYSPTNNTLNERSWMNDFPTKYLSSTKSNFMIPTRSLFNVRQSRTMNKHISSIKRLG